MFVIKQATTADIPLINKLAWNVFPETYKTSNPQLSSSASFLRLNVLSSLN